MEGFEDIIKAFQTMKNKPDLLEGEFQKSSPEKLSDEERKKLIIELGQERDQPNTIPENLKYQPLTPDECFKTPPPMNLANYINEQIEAGKSQEGLITNDISDGYHTFGELYEHRITLYIQLLKNYNSKFVQGNSPVWKSKIHSDGTSWNGWFLLGVFTDPGQQITYHLPTNKWDECSFAETREIAPEFDGHTSSDVLERIKNL
jgi:hypothetical protein